VAAGRALHADQILDRRDPHRESVDHLVGRVRVEVGEPLGPRRRAEDVERAHRRAEREAIAGAQRARIELERHVAGSAADVSIERPERVGQSREVVVVARVADVEVAGDHR